MDMNEPFKPEHVVAHYKPMLDAVMADAKADLQHLKIDKQAFVLASVYLTILHSCVEAAMLLRESTITVGAVIRSVVESFADLSALAKNAKYARRMLATLYEQRCRLFQDMLSNPANQYHASLAQQLNPSSELAEATRLLDVEKRAGFHPLSNYDRLDCAGMSNEYRSLYWQLCLESHNNIATVEARHIVETNGSYGLVLAKANPPGTLLKYYDSLISILIEASLLTHSTVNSSAVSRCRGVAVSRWRGGESGKRIFDNTARPTYLAVRYMDVGYGVLTNPKRYPRTFALKRRRGVTP